MAKIILIFTFCDISTEHLYQLCIQKLILISVISFTPPPLHTGKKKNNQRKKLSDYFRRQQQAGNKQSAQFPHLYRDKNGKILAKLSAYTCLYFCLLDNEAALAQKCFISLLQLVSSNNTQELQTSFERIYKTM